MLNCTYTRTVPRFYESTHTLWKQVPTDLLERKAFSTGSSCALLKRHLTREREDVLLAPDIAVVTSQTPKRRPAAGKPATTAEFNKFSRPKGTSKNRAHLSKSQIPRSSPGVKNKVKDANKPALAPDNTVSTVERTTGSSTEDKQALEESRKALSLGIQEVKKRSAVFDAVYDLPKSPGCGRSSLVYFVPGGRPCIHERSVIERLKS